MFYSLLYISLTTPVVQLLAWLQHSIAYVCLFVHAIKRKRHEISAPNLIHIYSIAVDRHALTEVKRSKVKVTWFSTFINADYCHLFQHKCDTFETHINNYFAKMASI